MNRHECLCERRSPVTTKNQAVRLIHFLFIVLSTGQAKFLFLNFNSSDSCFLAPVTCLPLLKNTGRAGQWKGTYMSNYNKTRLLQTSLTWIWRTGVSEEACRFCFTCETFPPLTQRRVNQPTQLFGDNPYTSLILPSVGWSDTHLSVLVIVSYMTARKARVVAVMVVG